MVTRSWGSSSAQPAVITLRPVTAPTDCSARLCSSAACLPPRLLRVHQPPGAPCSQRQAPCSSCCPLPTSMVTPLPSR